MARPRPGATEFSGRTVVDLLELPEQAIGLRLVEPDTGVHDGKFKETAAVRISPAVDADGDPAFIGELDAVAGQVEQDLADAAGVEGDGLRQARMEPGADFQAFRLSLGRQQFHHAFHQRRQAHGGRLNFQLAGLHLGKVQHFVRST